MSSDFIEQRLSKIKDLRDRKINPYPNDFTPRHLAKSLHISFNSHSQEDLSRLTETFVLAGRLMARRDFGKTAFSHILDRSGKIQAYVTQEELGKDLFSDFLNLDIGDFVGVEGTLFKTKTGELTLKVKKFRLLTKALRPLPEKFHGLTDTELRYRQRYLDLIMNDKVRDLFIKRTAIIQAMRDFLNRRDFLEVETPMMQPLFGGALARPFMTHHNALDIDLYLRIAPELYLKRLVVGGLERVYEINRNFRNEGISTQHNPEFTMVEFYQSYATYEDLMDLTEEMFGEICQKVLGTLKFEYQGKVLSLDRPWKRIPMLDALQTYADMSTKEVSDQKLAYEYALGKKIALQGNESLGKILAEIFDTLVQPQLEQPTFIFGYPIEISPLARKNEKNPKLVDRFELFIAGREIANAFSELNDPFDQRGRFEAQLEERKKGDEEAHEMDEDFLRALEYGMPPTAGEGIGIDRLVMLLTDSSSIRDVIFFPQLKPERGSTV